MLSAPALRIPVNLRLDRMVLVRSPRARQPRIGPGAIAVVALVLAVIIASMFCSTPGRANGRGSCRSGLHDFADEITDFGRSGCVPLSARNRLLALAGHYRRGWPRMTQGVLAAACRSLRLLVFAIGLPGLFAPSSSG